MTTLDEAPAVEVFPDGYEVVNGRIVEPPPMSTYASLVANRLNLELGVFGRATAMGQSVVETLFRVALPDDPTRDRRPDVAFVSFESWAADRPVPIRGGTWHVVPDFACEVVSPNDVADDVIDKVFEYMTAGVRLVWVIFPTRRQIYAYASPVPRVFGPGESADGGDVLPGFRVAVDSLFPAAEVV